MKYLKEAADLWRSYVPKSGQAATVQGELIRGVEKLRDEAQRNGNINWGGGHVILAEYLRQQLLDSALFDDAARAEINRDVDRLLDSRHPETADDTYDRLTDRIVEWSRVQPSPVPHVRNPALHI